MNKATREKSNVCRNKPNKRDIYVPNNRPKNVENFMMFTQANAYAYALNINRYIKSKN